MGDLVLTEDQVNPVMSVALDNGLDVTALHNHFFWESPRVMFMHIGGMGDEKALASAVGKVFAKIKETSGGTGESPKVQVDPAQTSVDGSKIDAVLGAKGKVDGGIYKATIGRTTHMHGTEAGNAMGVNTWAAFAGSDDNAVVDGDLAMLENELQPVLKELRKASINIVAIHQHMTGEQPRILFLHYWGTGTTRDLARGLRAALDRTATRLGRSARVHADDPLSGSALARLAERKACWRVVDLIALEVPRLRRVLRRCDTESHENQRQDAVRSHASSSFALRRSVFRCAAV